ncbi:cytochrome P450 [Streptomyces anulatus]|uniref:cytochrome P450 n=1 Tax=Streptomyces TaxID=1883 RepID=UPI00067BFDB1|nr:MULTISPECIES: cytochrome P450 [Streptomyces]KND37667.1 cytochrome P450 [Streptomyces europaeiscabiei]MDF9807389.1 cytochrome P450 [Streptomyces sp. HB372]KQX43764.1 cytochrome P450 [Streptomyces sp. Root1295]KRA34329.1 cytochrome P450 [Streptomyces sp. Root63]MBT1102921.1 cytochrome P450 [Streptomyces sp. Tu10]
MTATGTPWTFHQDQFWMRGEEPPGRVVHDEAKGLWNIYGWDESLQALGDPETFSSDLSVLAPEGKRQIFPGNLTTMDPPDHTKLRKIVSGVFTRGMVAALEPRIKELTLELLAGTEPGSSFDLVEELAHPLPVIVIAELLGVPSSDRHLFREWVSKLLANNQSFSTGEDTPELRAQRALTFEQIENLSGYLREHVESRRVTPREDLLGRLVEAEVDGQRLSTAEVVNFAFVLLVAGHITTTMLLGNTILCLDAHPQAMKTVREDRERIPSAIEESLRLFSPLASLRRVTTKATRIGDAEIAARQVVMVWTAVASRDTRQFGDPHTFDIDRRANAHLAFGRGSHFCMGAPLARLEGRLALDILFDRYPGLRRDPDRDPVFMPGANVMGVEQLHLLT